MKTKAQDDALHMQILLDSEALPHEVTAVEEIVQKEGVRCSVCAGYFRKSAGDLPWVTLLLAPIAAFLAAFLAGAGQDAGRDAYQSIRRLVSRLYAARRDRNGSIVVMDDDTLTHIVLQPDLPEEAYRQLAQMDPEQLKGGHWVWDKERNHWLRG